jgi:RNA polymerase-binding transcription factor DksA
MRYFTIEQRETLREALTNRAALLRDQVPRPHRHNSRFNHTEGSRFIAQASGGSSFSTGDADHADNTESLELRKVEETLVKLRSPDFGICEECSGDIPYVLLKANPFTALCRECQQRMGLAPFVPAEM